MLRLTNSWSESTDSPECSICYDEYEPSFDNVTILLKCYHKFHTNPCLKKYINEKQIALKQQAIQEAIEEDIEPPTTAQLNIIADKIECPFCKTVFSLKKLTYNNFKSVNIWPLNPNAPKPILPEAPKKLDNMLIYKNIFGANGNSPSRLYQINHQQLHVYGTSGDHYRHYRYYEPNNYYSFYKDNLGPRCPYPHMLPNIQIPQPTDPLEFIEMQYEAAVRNNNIALNDYNNAIECYTTFYESFIQSKGIAMSDIDRVYNEQMTIITHDRLVETERVKTTIKQILDGAKTLLGRFKSGVHRVKESVSRRSKTIKKRLSDRARNTYDRARNTLHSLRMHTMPTMHVRIEGGKKKKSKKYNKTKKAKKHKNSRKC